jgi:hypothetical protein
VSEEIVVDRQELVIDSAKREPACRILGCDELQERPGTRYCHRHAPLVKAVGGSWLLPRVRSRPAKSPGRAGRPPREDGRYINRNGYVMVRVGSRYIPEHRLVMMAMLGRPLHPGESIHHRNGVRHDNRPENLELWVGPIRRGARATDLVCIHCGRPWLAEAPTGPRIPIQAVVDLIESGAWPADGRSGISETFKKSAGDAPGLRGAPTKEAAS